jgi:diadenosine tetraphosphate (Ap4A) HIT family hydrolase
MIIRIKNALKKSFDADGFNVAWNEGVSAGQTVDHLHIHIVPRKAGDAGIYEYEPRKFLYRPGSRIKSPKRELREIACLIGSHME